VRTSPPRRPSARASRAMGATGRTAELGHGAILKSCPRRSAARSRRAGVPATVHGLQIEDALLEGSSALDPTDGVRARRPDGSARRPRRPPCPRASGRRSGPRPCDGAGGAHARVEPSASRTNTAPGSSRRRTRPTVHRPIPPAAPVIGTHAGSRAGVRPVAQSALEPSHRVGGRRPSAREHLGRALERRPHVAEPTRRAPRRPRHPGSPARAGPTVGGGAAADPSSTRPPRLDRGQDQLAGPAVTRRPRRARHLPRGPAAGLRGLHDGRASVLQEREGSVDLRPSGSCTGARRRCRRPNA